MGKRRDRLQQVKFRCQHCSHSWQGEPDRVEDDPDESYHPWRYYASCPSCGSDAEQAQWERALLKAHASATGPKTAEGKARSAKNLDGHPTAEEAQRHRFNAMKHGLYAQTARYFPARPGKYPQCDGCEFRGRECPDETDVCLKKTELFMRYQMAFESGDPQKLSPLNMQLQATVRALTDDILLRIIQDGVAIEQPAWYYDKDGGFHLAEYTEVNGHGEVERRVIREVQAHPLLKPLLDLLARNKMTMDDMDMTAKGQSDQALIRGHLEGEAEDRQTALTYQQEQTDLLQQLQEQIQRSRARTQRDPILIEHEQAEGGDNG